MRRVLVVLLAAALLHVASLWLLPRAIVAYVRHRVIADVGVNTIHHAPLPDETWHGVPMPSPDQLYAACAYDVSQGAVEVSADVPDSYFSISAFADNTDNVFVADDRELARPRARLLLTRDPGLRDPEGRRLLVVPTARGVVLFRWLVLDRAELPRFEALARSARCEAR